VKNFYEAVNSPEIRSSLDKDTASTLRSLFRLHALHTLDREASEFFSSAAVTVRQIGLTQTSEVPKLLDEIRPHAVRLVDSWKIPDWQLDSALGRSDGDVYPDLFKRASMQNPVNDLVFDPYPWNENVLKNAGEIKSKL
jgi:acyl-CoA oxidase